MKKIVQIICIGILFISPQQGQAQSFSIKPYIGFAQVSMDDVNDASRSRVNALRNLTGNYVPYPDELKGNYAGGIQVSYHLENNYHLVAGTYYFRERRNFQNPTGADPDVISFQNDLIIELFEVQLGIKYYLRHQTWNRLNFYFAGTAGFAFGWNESVFIYLDDVNQVDNKGEFSSSALIGYFFAGASFRISSAISLEPEVGYRLANFGKMDGTLQVYQDINNDITEYTNTNYRTEANYDFSGFYLNFGISFQIFILE